MIADWDAHQYLFFIGCYFAMGGVIETLFLDNCNEFADLVRSGDLDFFLLKPIDEQFLVSCQHIDWSMRSRTCCSASASWAMRCGPAAGNSIPSRRSSSCILFTSGAALAYGFLLMLTSASVWLMRNQSLFEMWWLFTTLMRYPREIFNGTWASPAGLFFSFVVPIMLVTNVPAQVMVQVARSAVGCPVCGCGVADRRVSEPMGVPGGAAALSQCEQLNSFSARDQVTGGTSRALNGEQAIYSQSRTDDPSREYTFCRWRPPASRGCFRRSRS